MIAHRRVHPPSGHCLRDLTLSALLLISLPAFAADRRAHLSAADYPSIQHALDANPGKRVFVPAGDHRINETLVIRTAGSGLWGPGRIVQSNPDADVIRVEKAPGSRISDLTLTRSEGKQETRQAGVRVQQSDDTVVENISVIDNWSDGSTIFVHRSSRAQIRGCLVRNYARISIDDRTLPGSASGIVHGFAFKCINGTGINLVESVGSQVINNRVVEHRLIPTPEIRDRFDLGRIVKKNAVKGSTISQEDWDANHVKLWRQGAAIHVGNGKTSHHIIITGNYIESAQQGFDLQGDNIVLAANIVNDAAHGMKAVHGSRNVIVQANQFARSDLWGIGIMPGNASHLTGVHPTGRSAPLPANVDGYSILASNIVSDFGFGLVHWLWPVGDRIGPTPIQLGGGAVGRPPLRDVILSGNIVYNPGPAGILRDGLPQQEQARYNYAVKVTGREGAMPETLLISNNVFHTGRRGPMTKEVSPLD